MKQIFLFLAAILFLQIVVAQDSKKGFSSFYKGVKYYPKAVDIFQKSLLKDSLDAFAYYGLARIYSDTSFANHDFFVSAKNYNKALDAWPKMQATFKKKLPNITKDMIESDRWSLADELFFKTKYTDSLNWAWQYIKYFYNDLRINDIIQHRNRLEYEVVRKRNSMVDYITFIALFPQAIQRKDAQSRLEELAYKEAMKTHTIESYQNFMENYPEAKQVPEASINQFMISSQKIQHKDLLGAYNQMINTSKNEQNKRLVQRMRTSLDSIKVEVSTFLGNEKRNYYGNKAPEKLDVIWKLNLGSGLSPAYGFDKIWSGAGWTGQPLFVREKNKDYVVIGAFDYNLKKIDAKTGKIVWQYKFDDILKGTGTIWVNHNADSIQNRYVILQGSRRGVGLGIDAKITPSLRGISYITGKELWRLNIRQTDSYSRDCDGSPLVIRDTAYLGLENAIFTVFDPDAKNVVMRDGILQPRIFQEIKYYKLKDLIDHVENIESESSPCYLYNKIFTTAGSGRVYGYNVKTRQNDWEFEIGSDLNGSSPVTYDSCLLVPVEKQYIKGKGGVYKLNPLKKGNEAVEWFFPVENKTFAHWEGGIIGSVSVNDAYFDGDNVHLCAFTGVDGILYIVQHDSLDGNKKVLGTDSVTMFPCPRLLYKKEIGGTISTPIFVGDKIIAASDFGVYLFQYQMTKKGLKVDMLDKFEGMIYDASPIAMDGKVYIAARDGYLYCLGKKN